ncbi:serine-rich adhesin for platelets-like [Acropora muricata]|uniref:serine-rich adhesin for platelets-like n=1 Tax=Acropora muricata TaxID=159855 RepID=UPI0034E4757B
MNNKLGSEALFQASSACKLRLVRMLIEGGTSANVRNERLETPLMLCCQSRADAEEKQKVTNYLLSKKAKVNLQDIDGRTALIHASLSNSGKEIIQALLDAKASPWLQDESKNTVFDYVINAGDLETTRLLINACRDNMMADDRDMDRMKYLEEYLANVQDMRKVSWPLMGPRALTNHMKVYVAKKDETAPSSNNRLGCDLAAENSNHLPQPERRRKRSVCLFDPLDLQEVLNSDEVTTEAAIPKKETFDDDKGERRKTSVRSLSEEERFSFQISDDENAAEESLPELEKLLRLQDSFSSSIDSNDSPSTAYEPADHDRCEYVHEQVYQEINSLKQNRGFIATKEEKNKYEDETCALCPAYETKQELIIRNKGLTQRERRFRFSLGSQEMCDTCTSYSERPKKPQGDGVDRATPDSKVGLDISDKEGNQLSSHDTRRQSSSGSVALSPRVTGRQTIKARTLKQSSSPRVSPVTVQSGQSRRDASLVRRYTLSEMDMGKLPSADVVPQVRSTSVEPLEQTRSATFESTNQVGPEGSSTPPGLRKSKSDMSDWISMSEYFQETEIIELTQMNCQNTHQNTAHLKFDGNEIGQAQLPSISPTRKVRPSPKDGVHVGSGVLSPTKSKQANVENRSELAHFLSKSSIGNEKCFKSQSRVNLSTDPSNGSSFVFSDKSHTSALPSKEDTDKEQEDTLPDLLLSCLPQDGHSSRHGSISPPNSSSITTRDITASSSTTAEEQTAGSSQGQQRLSPRLRPGTLLPPLLITNRRTPTHEMEDGYFSGSPSPADVESPRKKHSHEHLSYSFKPISPRSPIPAQKVFALQTGKPPLTPR